MPVPDVDGTAAVLGVASVSGILCKLASAAAELRDPPGGGSATSEADAGVTSIAESVFSFVSTATDANISRPGGAIDARVSRGLLGRPTRTTGSHGCLLRQCREIFGAENHPLQMLQNFDLYFILVFITLFQKVWSNKGKLPIHMRSGILCEAISRQGHFAFHEITRKII